MDSFMKRVSMVQCKLKAPKGQTNKFGKYNYRSCEDILEAVKPLLAEQGLVLAIGDEMVQIGDRFYVKATATLLDAEGNGNIQNTAFAREPAEKKGMDASQVTGATSSYARKYALNGLLCIDDTRDADTPEYGHQVEPAKREEAPPPPTGPLICSGCGAEIIGLKKNGKIVRTAEQVVNHARETYGKPLCWKCIKAAESGSSDARAAG